MSEIELKRCRCGVQADVWQDDDGYYVVGCGNWLCPNCAHKSMDKYKSEESAIKAWNRRIEGAANELKPCQCGSDVELCRGDDDYYIYCPKCKLQTFSDRVYENITDNCDRLIEVWNRRANDGTR